MSTSFNNYLHVKFWTPIDSKPHVSRQLIGQAVEREAETRQWSGIDPNTFCDHYSAVPKLEDHLIRIKIKRVQLD